MSAEWGSSLIWDYAMVLSEHYGGGMIDELDGWQVALEIARSTNADAKLLEHIERQIARIKAKLTA